VDAPATLERMHANEHDSFASLVPRYDMIFTYGGGQPVIDDYLAFGARHCVPIYNALDPSTHYPVPPTPRFASDLSFLGNRLPDREARVDEFFFKAAKALPDRNFLIGGSGWVDSDLPGNVRNAGHVLTTDHNAFNCSARAVLNISRASMARYGFSPATRVFEAAGAGACLITDAWDGIEEFFEPDREILVAAHGAEVAGLIARITVDSAASVGRKAYQRVLAEHTYAQRAALFEETLDAKLVS
jgi:spore maturation protein CgeB